MIFCFSPHLKEFFGILPSAEFLLTKNGSYDIIKMTSVLHIVSLFKNIWQGLQSCLQMFYKRVSLKMLTTLATNIFNLIR